MRRTNNTKSVTCMISERLRSLRANLLKIEAQNGLRYAVEFFNTVGSGEALLDHQ